ncbi:hypothetical protein RI367_004547 [Sorochytrium milnesiophthora]
MMNAADKENMFAPQQTPLAGKNAAFATPAKASVLSLHGTAKNSSVQETRSTPGAKTPAAAIDKKTTVVVRASGTPLANVTNRTPGPARGQQQRQVDNLAKSVFKLRSTASEGAGDGPHAASPLSQRTAPAMMMAGRLQRLGALRAMQHSSAVPGTTTDTQAAPFDEVEYGPPTMQYEEESYWSTQFDFDYVKDLIKCEPPLLLKRALPPPAPLCIDDDPIDQHSLIDTLFADLGQADVLDDWPPGQPLLFEV